MAIGNSSRPLFIERLNVLFLMGNGAWRQNVTFAQFRFHPIGVRTIAKLSNIKAQTHWVKMQDLVNYLLLEPGPLTMRKLLIVIFCFCFSRSSIAMTCIADEISARYNQADFVFEATVTKRQKLEEPVNGICPARGTTCGAKIATVNIGEVWKGQFAAGETTIYSEDACNCLGTFFPVGAKYIVFGKKSDQQQYQVRDMGACWTEDYDSFDEAAFESLSDLKGASNR